MIKCQWKRYILESVFFWFFFVRKIWRASWYPCRGLRAQVAKHFINTLSQMPVVWPLYLGGQQEAGWAPSSLSVISVFENNKVVKNLHKIWESISFMDEICIWYWLFIEHWVMRWSMCSCNIWFIIYISIPWHFFLLSSF